MHRTINGTKPIKEINGLTSDEKKLLSAWRETHTRHKKNSRQGDRLMMFVEMANVGNRISLVRCHHISRNPICGEPTN